MPGIAYPVFLIAFRRALQRLISRRNNVSSDFIGMLGLLLELFAAVPQFYVLAAIDSPLHFLSSAIANVVTETLEAAMLARAAASRIDPMRNKSVFVRRFASAVFPEQPRERSYASDGVDGKSALPRLEPEDATPRLTPVSLAHAVPALSSPALLPDAVPALSSPDPALGPPPGTPASPARGRTRAKGSSRSLELQLTAKLMHEELGEKASLFIGTTFAFATSGHIAATTWKLLTLLFLEATSDEIKIALFAAVSIQYGDDDVAIVSRFKWHQWLGFILVGAASCSALSAAVRVNCIVGGAIAAMIG
jgi:hypothetical protein